MRWRSLSRLRVFMWSVRSQVAEEKAGRPGLYPAGRIRYDQCSALRAPEWPVGPTNENDDQRRYLLQQDAVSARLEMC